MLNRFQFNESINQQDQGQFNASAIPVMNVELDDDIVFNNYGLQNSAVITSFVDNPAPMREVNFATLPYLDGELFNSEYFRRKRVTLKGRIIKTTQALLEAEIDTFKEAMSEPDANLDIATITGGTKRRYKATLINPEDIFQDRAQSDITTVPFTLIFDAHSGFGEDISYTNQDTTATSKEHNFTVWNTGTFEAPIWFIINLTTITGITAIELENLTTGESVTITRSFSSGELLEVDGITKTVTVNSTAVDYDGYFPQMKVGANLFKITFTGTSVTTASITSRHKNRFL